jgi:hypothetical protein
MILEQINQRKLDRQQAVINSAALQDHIMKSYNLKVIDPFKKNIMKPPALIGQVFKTMHNRLYLGETCNQDWLEINLKIIDHK